MNHLRILIVEDSEDDTLLTLRELRRGGYRLDYVRVDTSVAMESALDQQPWDIVIADYSMPAFSAPEALKILQSRKLDLPFIIISGTIGEDTAVAAMKAGASDYLIKGNLARLVPAVERELREAIERHKRHSAEKALQQAEQQIREQAALLDVATDAICVQDLEHNLLFWSKGAERLYGWEAASILGKSAVQLLYKDDDNLPNFEAMVAMLAREGNWQGELQQVTKNGKDIVVESRWTLIRDLEGNPKSILNVSTDITEKKQLQAQFLRAQRLESVGTLASGIAHDFNNILTPILAVAQLLPLKLPNLDDNTKQLLNILEDSAKRGADLVKQILSFTRRGVEGSCTIVQARHLLLDVAKVAQRTFPKSIKTQTDIAPDLWTIFADATQIHQVLMNLIVNARDAMPDGGILDINATNLWVDQSYARMHMDATVGSYIVITVTDTGTGIAPSIIDRIFDPFFTTKEVGKGTGLGLSSAMGIIKNHNGFLNVYSELGKGSSFRVYLPSCQVNESEGKVDVSASNGNGELILVVDDETIICEVTKTTLLSHNYKVLTANDGIEALALYAQYKKDIDLVLIDLMMPSMDGDTTILTLQRMNPQVKIIAMSGLISKANTCDKSLNLQEFLPKPFTTQALLSTIQKVLHPNLCK
ncbi:multi-sensor hybrid histidine kinase [Calothrix sp. NIES-4071]|nr:multi-sensor hybrid histidine kinase [Calothrix sp. NIES-4071]BAZ64228.1 multi-sensor hybrid histidine kinase [Calothrix sp. NIES-4105]